MRVPFVQPILHIFDSVSAMTKKFTFFFTKFDLDWSERKLNMKITGKVPGVDASNSDTAVFAGNDRSFGAPENNLLFDRICACTSRPTTLLYLPL